MFSIEGSLIEMFSLFQVCFWFQNNVRVQGRNVWNWKVEDVCNWPCCPHWVKLFGRSVSPGGGDLAVIGGVEHPRICSIPKYRRFPGFPPWKAPGHRLFVISPKSSAAPPVPQTMHLAAFSELQFPMALQGLAYILPAEWQCWTFLLKRDMACTLTQNEVRRKVECYSPEDYRRSGRFKMRLRFPTADDGS